MVRAARVEHTTYGFGDRHSIQLSYALMAADEPKPYEIPASLIPV